MSFYCPQCNNLYTKITPFGKIPKNEDQENIESPTPSNVSSTTNISKGGDLNNEGNISTLIKKILSGETIDEKDMSNITNIDVILDLPSYKKLTGKQKEIVYNIINDKIPKKTVKKDKVLMDKRAHFECTNCGFSEAIKDGTLIMRRVRDTYITNEQLDTSIYQELINAKELPITRAYTCPNKSCKSHENHELRQAVMFRSPNSIKIEYICKTCAFHWI